MKKKALSLIFYFETKVHLTLRFYLQKGKQFDLHFYIPKPMYFWLCFLSKIYCILLILNHKRTYDQRNQTEK